MFVFNFSLNKKKYLKVFKIIIVILAILIFTISIFAIIKGSSQKSDNSDSKCLELTSDNYTNFLKDCHESIDKYIGTEISVTGYIYKLPDFNDNQFVLARTMLMNSNSQAVVVGILCETASPIEYNSYSWVQIKGTIEKGFYKEDIPVLKVDEIKQAKTPKDEFVFEPID